MSTQIDNLLVSFHEILFHIGNLFDELLCDRTSNILLPNNNRVSRGLDDALKVFDGNLDKVLIQLNDVSLFEAKLKQRANERKQKELQEKQEREAEERKRLESAMVKQATMSEVEQVQPQHRPSDNFGNNSNDMNPDYSNGDNLLNDISSFLSKIPGEGGDINGDINGLMMAPDTLVDGGGTGNFNMDMNGYSNGPDEDAMLGNSNDGMDLNIDFGELDEMLNLN